MNKYVLYSKVAIIRERQLQENKDVRNLFKRHEEKMDILSEIERLKGFQKNEENELFKKDQRKQGALIIVDQMKAREEDRIRNKEKTLKERQEVVKYMRNLEQEDKRKYEIKKQLDDKLAKEVEESNRNMIEMREKKKMIIK